MAFNIIPKLDINEEEELMYRKGNRKLIEFVFLVKLNQTFLSLFPIHHCNWNISI